MSLIPLKIIKFLIVSVVLLGSSIQILAAQNTPKPQFGCGSDRVAGWSPDGKQILFISERTGSPDIWVMDTNGEHAMNLTADSKEDDLNPVWSPDGKFIAFLSDREKYSNLWVMYADGSHLESLDTDASHVYGSPVWAIDGTKIAVVFANGQKTDIGFIDIKTKTLKNLTQNSDVSFKDASWSFDDTMLAVTTLSNTDVYVMNADGSDLSIIESGSFNIQVTWSPVNDLILITKVPHIGSDSSDIWQINLKDKTRLNLTESNKSIDISPVWSPNGQYIIFISDRGNHRGDIWKMTATGTHQSSITKNFDGSMFGLVWSPEATQIAFSAIIDEQSNIWVLNFDGSGLRNLTKASC